MNNMNKLKIIWKGIIISFFIISFLIFTPFVIPKGIWTPELFGIPYSLWIGIVIYLTFLCLTIIGISIHSKLFIEKNND
jgi:hypothetical protein